MSEETAHILLGLGYLLVPIAIIVVLAITVHLQVKARKNKKEK